MRMVFLGCEIDKLCSIFVTNWFLVFCAKMMFLGVKLINFELVVAVFVRYTLWNAEYRMSLTRNLEMSHADQGADCETPLESLEVKGGEEEHGETEKVVSDLGLANSEICSSSTGAGVFGDFPPQALKYIQQLQSELTNMKEVTLILFYCYVRIFCCYGCEIVTFLRVYAIFYHSKEGCLD